MLNASGQQVINPYSPYFEEAYQKHPSIPRGVLEAIAYTRTRIRHVIPEPSCLALPPAYGVMGLVEDGQGYFESTLPKVAQLSGYPAEEIKRDPRINILAFAAAYAQLQSQQTTSRSVTGHGKIVHQLSEIPQDSSLLNSFAADQEFYAVLREMQSPHTGANQGQRTRQVFDYEAIFGKENFKVLSADRVTLSSTKVRSVTGATYTAPACNAAAGKPNYPGAIWKAAHSRNYTTRPPGVTVDFVTIHTIQGSYASCISWFQNPNARVSAHYIVRAFDGQVTQMVCEEDKAFHVKTDNNTAIGIEHEGFVDDGLVWYTQAMYESSAALVRDICARRNIDPKMVFAGPATRDVRVLSNNCYHIKGHQHFRNNNHVDPGMYWDWERYYRMINPQPAPTVLTAQTGTLHDPGGPGANYPDNNRTAWVIKPQNASSILIKFTQFDMEGTMKEPFDYLDVYDGENADGRFLGRFSGSGRPAELLSQTGSFFLEMRSDCGLSRPGFSLTWEAKAATGACGQPTNLAVSELFPMGATLGWDAANGAEKYVVMIKRRTYETAWTRYIVAEPRVHVTGLAANGLYEWQVMAVCGTDTSARSGSALVTPGVSRTTVPAVYTTRARSGFFYDSGGRQAGYAPGESYLYRILPQGGGQIELVFSSFETEPENDVMKIYDGPATSGKLLGTFSGKNLPPVLRSTQGGLTIQFMANNRTEALGWIAQWRTLGEGGELPVVVTPPAPRPPVTNPPAVDPVSGNPVTPTPRPGPNNPPPAPSTPTLPAVANTGLEVTPYLHPRAAPVTRPQLANTPYNATFNLRFEDRDRSGKGLANRFVTIALETQEGFRSNPRAGFFYDDFNRGLSPSWNAAAGKWRSENGRIVQSDDQQGNANLWTDVRQTSEETYLYHWKARMTGSSGNLRSGIHFFCSQPERPNRGNSYFVWIRDGKEGDQVEIYKTVDDKFDRKARKETTLESGKTHDYKVICNPKRGRIEVYINNRFVVAWDDPYPLWAGKGISLRTGDAVAEFDDVVVYKSRETAESRVSVGAGEFNALRGPGRFLAASVVVDRNINWSAWASDTGTVRFGGGTASASPEPQAPPTGVQASYRGSFLYLLPSPDAAERFFLPLAQIGGRWQAPQATGRYFETFDGTTLTPGWTPATGSWRQTGGALEQTQTAENNANVYFPLGQGGTAAYLYHFRAKILTDGPNSRFGLHFMASDGKGAQRGNSYLVWFRHVKGGQDMVEVYRMENNVLSRFRASRFVTLPVNTWHDVKITFDPGTGTVTAWLNDKQVISWKDDKTPLTSGSFLSFRTGSSQVQFDHLNVYRQHRDPTIQVTVGAGANSFIPTPAAGREMPVRLLTLSRSQSDRWSKVTEDKTTIKP